MQLTINVISPLGLQHVAAPKATTLKGGIQAAIKQLQQMERELDEYRREHWERVEVKIDRH